MISALRLLHDALVRARVYLSDLSSVDDDPSLKAALDNYWAWVFIAELDLHQIPANMAEIGLIASIVSVAGAGLQIAMSLRQLASEIREAAREVHDVATSVSLFSMTLKHVGNCVKGNASPHSESALVTLEEIITNCRSTFNKVESMISQVRKDTHRRDDQEAMSLSAMGFEEVQGQISDQSVGVIEVDPVDNASGPIPADGDGGNWVRCLKCSSVRESFADGHHSRSREGIEAARIEVGYLQAEIQSLILDRVWVQRKDEGEINAAMSEEDRLPLSADADTLSDRQTSGPSSATVEEADQSIDNSRALTLYSPNSLAALDASLSEEDESQYIISQNTISRSMIAINYLLKRWNLGTRSDARKYSDDDRPHYRNRTGLPKPSKENLYSKPSTRFTTSQSMSDSNRSGQPFQSHKKVPESSGTVEQKNRRQSKQPDIMQSIPFKPVSDSHHLNPIMSYKTANPDLIWETTYDAHLEAFNSENDKFCWEISDGADGMRFQGKYYLFTYPRPKGSHHGNARTYLPLLWFSQHALRQEGHTYDMIFFHHSLDFSRSPLTGKETCIECFRVPGLLDYNRVSELRRLSFSEELGYSGKYLTTHQHLQSLRNLRILKFLADKGSGSAQVQDAQEQSTRA